MATNSKYSFTPKDYGRGNDSGPRDLRVGEILSPLVHIILSKNSRM